MNNEHDSNSEQNNLGKENPEIRKQEQELHRQNELLRLEEEERRLEKLQRQQTIDRFVQGIYYLGGALATLLTLRFLLRLFGANPDNLFASFILDLSSPFISPFANLFKNPQIGSGASFEITTLISIAIYSLLVWLVVRLINILWD
jgi:hypothetical protein